MDITALRGFVLDKSAAVYGAAAIITRPGEEAITATGLWLPPLAEDLPVGREFQRRDPRRILAFRVSEVAALPRGTLIDIAEYGGESRTWKVEGLAEHQSPEQIRVIIVPVPA
jgi:hypothetical protein